MGGNKIYVKYCKNHFNLII